MADSYPAPAFSKGAKPFAIAHGVALPGLTSSLTRAGATADGGGDGETKQQTAAPLAAGAGAGGGDGGGGDGGGDAGIGDDVPGASPSGTLHLQTVARKFVLQQRAMRVGGSPRAAAPVAPSSAAHETREVQYGLWIIWLGMGLASVRA